MENIDASTVEDFGDEWSAFDQTELDSTEHQRLFDQYFSVFPFDELRNDAEGFDLGCGSGRWAILLARRVGLLHCIDPAHRALEVAKRRLAHVSNVRFHCAGAHEIPLPDSSQDFGYSLGVLHHIPDTEQALADCAKKLKPGAPFLVYLYYNFDNRSAAYRAIWHASDLMRMGVCRLPFPLKKALTEFVAATVYWPLARCARIVERIGAPVDNIPLSAYRNSSFYTMRTDALDRFGTRLERRFSRDEIKFMMKKVGLRDIVFREAVPFWTACGRKA